MPSTRKQPGMTLPAAAPRQFSLFQRLPPEIRSNVWREALTVWTVWYTSHPHVNLQAHGLGIRMKPVDGAAAAPYRVGLACQEARHQMQRLYTKLLGCGDAAGSSAVYWLIPDRTVLYLGCPSRATDFLEIFHAHQSLSLRHLVLHWYDLVEVIRFSHSLARRCPGLETFILHAADRKTTCRCEEPLSHGLADWYATIVAWHHERLPYQEHPDVEMLQWTVGEYFGDRDEESQGPKLHFLPPELKSAVLE